MHVTLWDGGSPWTATLGGGLFVRSDGLCARRSPIGDLLRPAPPWKVAGLEVRCPPWWTLWAPSPQNPTRNISSPGAEAVRRLPEKWAQLCPIEHEPRPAVGGVGARCAKRYNCNTPQSGSGPGTRQGGTVRPCRGDAAAPAQSVHYSGHRTPSPVVAHLKIQLSQARNRAGRHYSAAGTGRKRSPIGDLRTQNPAERTKRPPG